MFRSPLRGNNRDSSVWWATKSKPGTQPGRHSISTSTSLRAGSKSVLSTELNRVTPLDAAMVLSVKAFPDTLSSHVCNHFYQHVVVAVLAVVRAPRRLGGGDPPGGGADGEGGAIGH